MIKLHISISMYSGKCTKVYICREFDTYLTHSHHGENYDMSVNCGHSFENNLLFGLTGLIPHHNQFSILK